MENINKLNYKRNSILKDKTKNILNVLRKSESIQGSKPNPPPGP